LLQWEGDCRRVVGALELHDCRYHSKCRRGHVQHAKHQKKVTVSKQQKALAQAQEEKAMRRLSAPAAHRRASFNVPKWRTRSASPTHRQKQSITRKQQRKQFVDRRRQDIAKGFKLREHDKLEKAKKEKAKKEKAKKKEQAKEKKKEQAKEKKKTKVGKKVADPTDVAAKRNARNVRRARCRHNASAAGCLFGVQNLPAEERELFSWIGPNNITVLPLNDNVSEKQREKKHLLLETLREMHAVHRGGQHWISRKVAIKATPKLRAKLVELVNRYRAMYNALVSVLNNDLSATFRKIADLTLEDGVEKLLNALKSISKIEVNTLEQELGLLLNLKFKLEQLRYSKLHGICCGVC
jgi:hypothetical protein